MRQRKKTPVYGLRRVAADEELQELHSSFKDALDFEEASRELDEAAMSPEQRRASFGLMTNSFIDFGELDAEDENEGL